MREPTARERLKAIVVSISQAAVTVSRVLVLKDARMRCVSKRVRYPSLSNAFSSGIRRTARRPVMRSLIFLELNAVNGISATLAEEIHVPVA